MKLILGVISLMGLAAGLNMHRQDAAPPAEAASAPAT